jgi:hypothetical protein
MLRDGAKNASPQHEQVPHKSGFLRRTIKTESLK